MLATLSLTIFVFWGVNTYDAGAKYGCGSKSYGREWFRGKNLGGVTRYGYYGELSGMIYGVKSCGTRREGRCIRLQERLARGHSIRRVPFKCAFVCPGRSSLLLEVTR